jgi:DGQHR domain-containing protein
MDTTKPNIVKYHYKALACEQRKSGQGISMLLFSAPVGEVLKWAMVERLEPGNETAAQRIEKPYKTQAVKGFFTVDTNNIIPTAVVIGLRTTGVEIEPVENCGPLQNLTISIDESVAEVDRAYPGRIVDGQHRVLGMKEYDPNLKVNIVALQESSDAEVAFQFLVINNKASRVSSDHIRALALNYNEAELGDRLKKVRLRVDSNLNFVGFADDLDDSPFKGCVNLPDNPEGQRLVVPAAIEESIKYIKSQNLPDFQDDDMVLSVFFSIWSEVQSQWGALWNAESKLLQKVSVVGLSKFAVDFLLQKYDWGELDLLKPKDVEGAIRRFVQGLEPAFWSKDTEWTAKGLDTSAGRKIFADALEQIVRNKRQGAPWHSDVSMVEVNGD